MNNKSEYLTVRQFSQKHQAFPEGGIRWNIYHSDTNGMDKFDVIKRIGRKILLDENNFFLWVDSGGVANENR